jgi:hypothetical protein
MYRPSKLWQQKSSGLRCVGARIAVEREMVPILYRAGYGQGNLESSCGPRTQRIPPFEPFIPPVRVSVRTAFSRRLRRGLNGYIFVVRG